MKRYFHGMVFGAAFIAARMMSNAGVYNQIGDTVPHAADELLIWSYSCNGAGAGVYISTNVLCKQPKWDGISEKVPLEMKTALSLARLSMQQQYKGVKVWKADSVSLRKLWGISTYPDLWYYEIDFKCGDDAIKSDFDQVCTNFPHRIVLFDGTVVAPRPATGNDQRPR